MAITTCWLLGSIILPETTVEVEGVPGTFAAGGWYLYHPTAALSLVDRLKAILLTEVDNADVWIGKDRRVRISGDGPFDLEWSTSFAALFGFSTNLTGQSTYTAASVSPLLWSPGRGEEPQESPLGMRGRKVYDTQFGTSPDGYQVADSHHTQEINTFNWPRVPTSRWQSIAQDTGQTGTIQGEFTRFFDVVLRAAGKFHLWRLLEESLTTDPTPQVWTGAHLGPYGYRPSRGAITWDFQRSSGYTTVDRFNNISLDCLVVPEFGV